MNRPIKFRAWDKKEECFVQDLHSLYVSLDIPNLISGERYVLLQFTGLHDKNGKEIYEGDICKVHDFTPEIVEIRWKEDGAGFAGYNAEDDKFVGRNPWLGIHPNHFEVIGNTYENPELLTK